MTKDILVHVISLESSAEVWSEIGRIFSTNSKARVANLCVQLANLKKGSMSTAAYFNKMITSRREA